MNARDTESPRKNGMFVVVVGGPFTTGGKDIAVTCMHYGGGWGRARGRGLENTDGNYESATENRIPRDDNECDGNAVDMRRRHPLMGKERSVFDVIDCKQCAAISPYQGDEETF